MIQYSRPNKTVKVLPTLMFALFPGHPHFRFMMLVVWKCKYKYKGGSPERSCLVWWCQVDRGWTHRDRARRRISKLFLGGQSIPRQHQHYLLFMTPGAAGPYKIVTMVRHHPLCVYLLSSLIPRPHPQGKSPMPRPHPQEKRVWCHKPESLGK